MNVARKWHTATKLADGRVLIAGGATTARRLSASAEIYDPTTHTFTPTGSMGTARAPSIRPRSLRAAKC
jgi:hypothetical protein